MTVAPNTLKAALQAGRVQLGLWQALASPYAAEICAGSGYDWLLFDGEHAPNDVPVLLAQSQAVAAYPVHAVARLPAAEAWMIKQYLDIGFTTLMVPMVETAEQAANIVRACRYPPRGVRGVGTGLARAARWNRIADYVHGADDEICLFLQVESVQGLENLDAICTIDGVDGIFIGPSDLSAALDHRGAANHDDVQSAIASAIATIRKHDKTAGILAIDPALVRKYVSLGCRFVGVGTDIGLLLRGSTELAASFAEIR